MTIRIPDGYGLTDADDAAVTCLREGCELHRMVRAETVGTVCGLTEGLLVHPFPSVGHVSLVAGSLCRSCFPQASVWARLVSMAHPDKVRGADLNSGPKFGPLNDSCIQPGVGNQSKGYR